MSHTSEKEKEWWKMTAYEVKSIYGRTIVVADNYAEASEIYLKKYWPNEILAIEKLNDYVLVKGIDS